MRVATEYKLQSQTFSSYAKIPGELVHCVAPSWPLPQTAQLQSGKTWAADPQTLGHIEPGQTDSRCRGTAHQESTTGEELYCYLQEKIKISGTHRGDDVEASTVVEAQHQLLHKK